MKLIYYSTLLLVACLIITSCNGIEGQESTFVAGTGGLNLKVPTTDKEITIPVIYTKAEEVVFDMQPETFPISIYEKDSDVKVKDFKSFTALIDSGTPLVLPVGEYTVKASSFTQTEKVAEKPYFEGVTDFEIEEGTVLNTSVLCTFKSMGVELRLSERFKELLADQPENYDYKVTASNEQATWTFDKVNMKPGYFLSASPQLIVKVVVKLGGQTYPERTWYFKNGENAPQLGEYYIVTLNAGKSELKMSSYKL